MPNFQKRTDTIEAVNFRGVENLVEVARLCKPTKLIFTKTDKEPAVLSMDINGKGYTLCAGDWLCIKTEPPYDEHTGVFFVISDDQFRAQYEHVSGPRFVFPKTTYDEAIAYAKTAKLEVPGEAGRIYGAMTEAAIKR